MLYTDASLALSPPLLSSSCPDDESLSVADPVALVPQVEGVAAAPAAVAVAWVLTVRRRPVAFVAMLARGAAVLPLPRRLPLVAVATAAALDAADAASAADAAAAVPSPLLCAVDAVWLLRVALASPEAPFGRRTPLRPPPLPAVAAVVPPPGAAVDAGAAGVVTAVAAPPPRNVDVG